MAILSATVEELGTSGYDTFSTERVARAAGVGKQTIYRWYPSKNELIADCVLEGLVVTPELPIADSGDVRGDISDWVRRFAQFGSNAAEMARVRAITAASADNADIASKFNTHVVSVTEAALADRLRTAVDAGQLKPSTSTRAVAHVIVGALLLRVLTRDDLDLDYADQILDIVFEGIEA
ncbi:TetR/AcrR family transcriptional regulator [Rhodococcoides yunnanense]|uniref:TetR/AcrR family transcriptional regulator n=1 Tax=Rhodococcoides yunnanense TaxID=278209 RepID=UPI000A043747|nr:TetR/AcrR family transcriptional regulator [Rhodococcus yunnanensis]